MSEREASGRQPTRSEAPDKVTSRKVQALVAGLAVLAAVGALAIGAAYDSEPETATVVFTGSAVDGGGDRSTSEDTSPTAASPIEGWFPRSGEGSTCSEPVGVDLATGYGAVLVINGTSVEESLMNPAESAGRSLGHYTYGPEPDCPNGSLLRPVDNSIQACVYRLTDGPETCRLTGSFSFDAL